MNELSVYDVNLEDIPSLDWTALQALEVQLRDDIMGIDAQLASRRVDFLSGSRKSRTELDEYHDWRRRAIGAKLIKTRMLVLCKSQIKQMAPSELRREHEQNQTENGFWRTQGKAFLQALEALENMPLSTEAMDVVVKALDAFNEKIETRRIMKLGAGEEDC